MHLPNAATGPSLFRTLLDLAAEACRMIEAIGPVEIQTKADGTPVTRADLEVADFLSKEVASHFPDALVETEEDPKAGEDHADARRPDSDRFMFHIDPIDGTQDFIRTAGQRGGDHTVLIGLRCGTQPVAGVIAAPGRGGEVWFGGPGLGAYHSLTGDFTDRTPIHTRSLPKDDAHTIMVLSPSLKKRGTTPSLRTLPFDVQFRSSAIKFAQVASGQADLHVRIGNTSWWDILAGDAIARGAGGKVYDLDQLLATNDGGASATSYQRGKPGPNLFLLGDDTRLLSLCQHLRPFFACV